MTSQIGHPEWVDELDAKLIDAFPGRVVRKDLVQRLKVGFSIPVYVLEYLLVVALPAIASCAARLAMPFVACIWRTHWPGRPSVPVGKNLGAMES